VRRLDLDGNGGAMAYRLPVCVGQRTGLDTTTAALFWLNHRLASPRTAILRARWRTQSELPVSDNRHLPRSGPAAVHRSMYKLRRWNAISAWRPGRSLTTWTHAEAATCCLHTALRGWKPESDMGAVNWSCTATWPAVYVHTRTSWS
jgi:hypothetical protein